MDPFQQPVPGGPEINPYAAPATPDQFSPPTRGQDGTISVFVVLNFVLAAICAMWVLMIGGVLIYGIFYSGDTGSELAAGVLGSLMFGMPGVLGLIVFPVAGLGLIKRRPWGYYAHVTGAIVACLTCVGIIYAIPALMIGMKPEFRVVFIPPRSYS